MAGESLDLTGALNKLISDPSLLTTIASAISGGMPTESAVQNGPKESVEANTVTAVEAKDSTSVAPPDTLPAMSKLSALGSLASMTKTPSNDSRACLLNALKPYMSPKRRDAIDKLVKFSNLSELLKKI